MTRTASRVWLAAALAASSWSCAHEKPYDKPRTPVRVEAVGPPSGSASLRYSAAVVPAQAVPVAFKVPGYIGEIAMAGDAAGGARIIQEGDRVRRGQVLARVRPDDFSVKVNQARSQQAEVEAAYVQAQQAFQRASTLYEKKSLTRGDYDAAKAAFDTVVARREGVRALINEAENALEDASLKSPLDGVVIKRMIEVGSLVGPGTPGFVVAQTASVKALFGAPEVVVRRLKRNQAQEVTSETYPNERFAGRVTSLAPAADPGSLVFDVEVTIPNHDGRLKPGMVVSLELPGDAPAPPLALPLAAVVRSPHKSDGYAVYVVEEKDGAAHARLRDVALGDLVSNGVAVTNGLRAGERVIVSGAKLVADGEAVEILR